ncbi:CutA protein [Candidatus Phycorickettsia trachydisci]|uniref:CutA protein n=1 Tax=Candidatus Phycorickettsia trachydisci TaxID=2115978 RepID=A0A2P1P7P2_9RICK|nr:divalent-cation tolerance protein CutA [Candidatus Phycorickettsia trachydisci]AVP87288.1 CutA protein [Candidatus Phycorickettsia trachydisci]
MKNISIVYTTIDSIENARKLARQVVELKIAACVNIIPNGLSIYFWEDKIEESPECFLLFKTSKTNVLKLKKWLIANHPYSIPAVLDAQVEINNGFLDFVEKYVKQ